MASVYKKKYPTELPAGAEIITRRGKKVARWESGKGQVRTAALLPDGRMQFVSDCWYVRYRDATGKMRRQSTGCHEKQAAEKMMADILADVDKLKAGIISSQEMKIANHANQSLEKHLEDYLEHLSRKRIRGRKVSRQYCKNIQGRLKRVVKKCRFQKLADISRTAMEKWLDLLEEKGLSAATRNEYLISLNSFCNWAVKCGRLSNNPVAGIGKADRSSDRRHIRRAMTAEEVGKLLDVAKRRPIAEVGRKGISLPKQDRCGRSTWTFVPLTEKNFEECFLTGLECLKNQPERRAMLEKRGQERAMFYLLAVSTGLRRKELASITISQLHLEDTTPHLTLHANDAKSGKAANIPLREDVVVELKKIISSRFTPQQGETESLPLNAKLLKTPPTIKVFDADIQAAGIAKRDARGRVVDIHALRYTFGTHLSAAGVHPRTAMAAMRHSRIELTMNLYTDPALLDIAGAVNSLPQFNK